MGTNGFDVVAFYESGAQTFAVSVTPVPDQFYRIAGDDLYVQTYAPYLAGVLNSGVSTPARCRVFMPKLTPAYDFLKSVLTGTADPYAGFTDLSKRPLPLYPNENLRFKAINASSEIAFGALFLSSGKITQAMLDAVNPTHSITCYSDTDAVAGTWVDLTLVWDLEGLPQGRYAIVGMKGMSYKASGPGIGVARVILKDNQWHPGCLMSIETGDRTLEVAQGDHNADFEYWPLMQGISFDNVNLPGIQVCMPIANTDHEFEFQLQKIA